jgi:ABC-type transport system involved in multi-copper enzyme maturation permease subunit
MKDVFLFELRFRFRQVSTYIFFAILFLFSFLFVTSDVVQIGGGSGQVKTNSPYVLAQVVGILGAFGAIMASALAGTAIYRDYEAQAHELFFTTRLKKRDYYFGRFFGAFLVTLIVYSGLLFGLLLGSFMPWVPASTLGPLHIESYINIFLLVLLPNVLLLSSVFFVFGALTRSLLAIYALGVLLFVGYAISTGLLSTLENRPLAALMDPFGLTAIRVTTQYWSLIEKNTRLLPLAGNLLTNRIFWAAISLSVLVLGYRLFQFSARGPMITLGRGRTTVSMPVPSMFSPSASATVRPSSIRNFLALTGFYVRDIIRGVPFLIITLAGILLLMVTAWNADTIFTDTVYPVTRIMVSQVSQSFMLFFLIITVFYGGELIWRERNIKLDQVTDALPTPTATLFLAKFVAMLVLLAVLNLLLIVAGMLVQILKGYFLLEPGLYFKYLFGTIYPMLACVVALAFVIHTIVNQKFLAHALTIGLYIATMVLPELGLEHRLLLFSQTQDITLSDMNGFGPFVAPVFCESLYWLFWSALFLVLTLKLWTRGKDESLRIRWRTGSFPPIARLISVAAVLGILSVGGWILYNTTILNEYLPKYAEMARRADYERTYKKRWVDAPMPRITDVDLDVTLWPERRQYTVKGRYRLKNRTNTAISDVFLNLEPNLTIHRMDFTEGATLATENRKLGLRIYHLNRPLAPGTETTLDFALAYEKTGFPNGSPNTAIVANGTFLTMPVPHIGYQPDGEITDASERKKQKLPVRPRMRPVSDLRARQDTYISNDADWIGFRATVRTTLDQIAIAPGYLKREWTEQGRRCFRYEMDVPILNFYTFVSARYQVKRDTWTAKDGRRVALEIFYHPGHEYNLRRMMAGMKAALTYCSTNYSSYQFHQLRILEFPAYNNFAQSFPNTIPYSEGIGFILRVKPDEIDVPFYVTAHEVAHQWWAHQVIGANVEGSEMLSESLAEYSALMTLHKTYGDAFLEHFTRMDLDRYLRGRGTERDEENPLEKVQNQSYIHYPKGALVFFALAERIGEQRLNRVLSAFVKKNAFQEPPYTTAPELVAMIRDVTPPEDQQYVSDLFEKITLYDLRVSDAHVQKVGTHWRVTGTVQAAKRYSDGQGNETEAPFSEPVTIALRGYPQRGASYGNILVQRRVRLVTGKQTVTLESDAKPDSLVVDPLHLYIDRTIGDNTTHCVP